MYLSDVPKVELEARTVGSCGSCATSQSGKYYRIYVDDPYCNLHVQRAKRLSVRKAKVRAVKLCV